MSPKQQKAENSHRNKSADAVLEQIIARHVAEAMARYEASHTCNDKKTNNGTKKRKRNDRSGQQSEEILKNSKTPTVISTKPNTYRGNKPKCRKCVRHHEGKCDYCNNCKRWGHQTRFCRINPPTRINNDTRPYTATVTKQKKYLGNKPKCGKCNRHHDGGCIFCGGCKRWGHATQACRSNPPPHESNNRPNRACYECGDPNHYRNRCPKLKYLNNNRNNNNNANRNNQAANQPAVGRAFVIGAQEARQDPNTVTGTFLVNNTYASVLFDSGANLSFVSTDFRPLLELESSKMDNTYTIELADGKLIESGEVVPGCTLALEGHSFEIDLLPAELESFNNVVGIDWLSKNKAKIVCYDKLVRIPPPTGEVLVIRGEKRKSTTKMISCIKANKYLRKGCQAFLAHVVEKKPEERRLGDIPIVCDYPDAFLDDLPGLPPPRQVEFHINLVPVAAPIARALYRLAPSEMQELSTQLQELLDLGFIRPSFSLWGAPVLFVK